MRLFAAVDLSEQTRAAIGAVQRTIVSKLGSHGLKIVRPEHLHLTLVFAGDVTDAQGTALIEMMSADVPQEPFHVAFGGVGAFPPDGVPRILWLGLREGARETIELQQRVAARFEAVGVELDRRPFHPHLTLARWRVSRRADRARLPQTMGTVAAVEAGGVTLYQSRLSSSGPTYVLLAHAHLTCQSSP